VNEWLFRSFLRWGRQVGVEELKRLQAEGVQRHVHGGGRVLTATAHGGKSSTFSFPAELGAAGLREVLEKVIWMLENFSEEDVESYLRNYPSSSAQVSYGFYVP
jgi:hypothetical protein